ncbi:MAG: monovalent cation/H+ antiporter complex subunit F [Defluviitaleaceae bacterium]|nr:monovalent cation/H+ antiporter complex subunit F [Defluviitaleaceae bacterium]
MIILWIMFVMLALYLIRVLKGPTIWDRLLGMNLISTKIIVVIIVFASLYETTFLLDFAIVYALMGFVSTIFIALFLSERKLGRKRGKK